MDSKNDPRRAECSSERGTSMFEIAIVLIMFAIVIVIAFPLPVVVYLLSISAFRMLQRHSGREKRGVFKSWLTTNEAGFSLVELFVVVLIVGVLSAASVVMFGKGRARYQLTQKAQTISSQIERARSLAVKYNRTLTLGFSSQNSVFGITCTDCPEPKSELPQYHIPTGISLSAYPTITIKGNGTIAASAGTIVVSDGRGRQVPITIANSGRTSVGDVSETSTTY
jgi:prepilin-type N-terminal cleavage/methylation domain-containing protein